ncbi:ABC transporter substrate-binding protein, partial [Neobacillus niacini]|uniref:ABC transporter substrate-binding protein n=1 Tax=Neobacillus niacini TaxID=86668 RepID=UPI002FFF5607
MKKMIKLNFWVSLIIATLILSGCGNNQVNQGASGAGKDEIVIGYIGPLSGDLSLLGNGVKDGLETYISYVNKEGGINGRKVKLIAEDDAYQTSKTIAAAKKLVERDKVVAIVAPAGTAPTAAIAPYLEEKKVPMLFPYAFSEALTNPIKRYTFTTLPDVRFQMQILSNYINSELKHKKIAAIYQNDDFGQTAIKGLHDIFDGKGVKLTELPYDAGTDDFSGLVRQAKESSVEHVIFLGIPRDAALVMKSANQMGWKPQFSGHNALGDPQTFALAGNELVEGALAVGIMEPLDSNAQEIKDFIDHQKQFLPKTEATTYSLHGYNAMKLFASVVESIDGDITSEAIVNSLEKTENWEGGLMGAITF